MKPSKLIERAHRHAHREWIKQGPKLGLTHSEFEYLSAIRDQEAMKADENDHGQHLHDVVAEMGVKKASASAMVVKLEERGLVHRVPCQYDARAQHILLTPKGQDVLALGDQVYDAAAHALMSEWTDEQVEVLVAALNSHPMPE